MITSVESNRTPGLHSMGNYGNAIIMNESSGTIPNCTVSVNTSPVTPPGGSRTKKIQSIA